MTAEEKHKKHFNPKTGMCQYKGYRIKPLRDIRLNKITGNIDYLGLSVEVDSLSFIDFTESFIDAIEMYLWECQEMNVEPIPPKSSSHDENLAFDEFCKTAPYRELLENKTRIKGMKRSVIIGKRKDLSDEEKKTLLPKRRHYLI